MRSRTVRTKSRFSKALQFCVAGISSALFRRFSLQNALMMAQAPGRPAPSAKSSITYVCRLLGDLGIACPAPEQLRQAKFDTGGAGVTLALWRALHDVCVLALCGFPQCGLATLSDATLDSHPQSAETHANGPLVFVMHTLTCWGCPHGLTRALSKGCSADHATTVSSRPLLLAFAWALAHTDAVAHALRYRLRQAGVRVVACIELARLEPTVNSYRSNRALFCTSLFLRFPSMLPALRMHAQKGRRHPLRRLRSSQKPHTCGNSAPVLPSSRARRHSMHCSYKAEHGVSLASWLV